MAGIVSQKMHFEIDNQCPTKKQGAKMNLLKSTLELIEKPSQPVMDKAQARLDNLTKPLGSLGRLEELAKKISGIMGTERPRISQKTIIVAAADHGVAKEGVSAFPQEVTPQMVLNFLSGGAGINVLARHIGANVLVVDAGVASDIAPHTALLNKKIAYGTKNMATGPAMSMDEAVKTVEAGIETAEAAIKGGASIIGTGDMGIGNTTASSAITAVITGQKPEDVTGRGTGIDDKSLANKVEVIKKAIKANSPDKNNALDILSKVGGFEIGFLCGVILACAANKKPVVIDGFISGAAALLAYVFKPETSDYMIASHCSVEKGHIVALKHMGLKPILDLDLRLGEGTGAALGISIAEAGVKILNEMATFAQAGVSEKNK